MFRPTSLASFLTLGFLVARVISAPAPAPRAISSISWGSCDSFAVNSTDPNLQCGYLEVPMDYHDSSAGNARLAVIKYVVTASKKLGTVFFNPGGPGGSGVDAITELGPLASESTGGLYEFVSWDPRGVGRTTPGPVYCFKTPEEDAAFFQNTVVYINETISGKFNQQDLTELYSQADVTDKKFETFTAGCQNGPSGPYLKYIGTSSTIRDLVSLGDAIVGEGQPIDYWGVSYGTVIGFNFVNMFPERAGHIILDGVVDPNTWISYKFLRSSIVDSEKAYSGLADGCAKAGKAGCKLVEITGDNVTGDDIKTLINTAHDIILEIYRQGYDVPVEPGLARALLFNLLYLPFAWSEVVNTDIYVSVALALQASQALGIPIPGGHKYNIPTQNITIGSHDSPPQGLVSYSQVAIAGVDDFIDNGVTAKDVFDIIVSNTRDISPTFGTVWSLGYTSYKWTVRSVERLPPYTPAKLKIPVLVIGNTADPITPFASAQNAANILGDNAFLVEQLGFGHTSLAQTSTCTALIAFNYLTNSTLPEGRGIQCAVDDPNLFPALNGTKTNARRSNFLRRWL